MHEAVWRGNGGLEIVLMPVLTGFLGYLIDGSAGTRPLFMVAFVVLGFVGSVANQYYRYVARMDQLGNDRAAAIEAAKDPSAPRFAKTVREELPSYATPTSQNKEGLVA